jgi:hypothetical protein
MINATRCVRTCHDEGETIGVRQNKASLMWLVGLASLSAVGFSMRHAEVSGHSAASPGPRLSPQPLSRLEELQVDGIALGTPLGEVQLPLQRLGYRPTRAPKSEAGKNEWWVDTGDGNRRERVKSRVFIGEAGKTEVVDGYFLQVNGPGFSGPWRSSAELKEELVRLGFSQLQETPSRLPGGPLLIRGAITLADRQRVKQEVRLIVQLSDRYITRSIISAQTPQ